MKSKLRLLSIVAAAASISTLASQAALVVTYASQAVAYTVSSTDLINGLVPVFTEAGIAGPGFTQEGTTLEAINNGALTTGNANFASAGGQDGGKTLVYDLAGSSDVSSITLYFGWADGGRDNAAGFSIYTKSSVFASDLGSYTLLATSDQTAPSNGGYFSQVKISDVGGNIASGVRSIYVSFGPGYDVPTGAENGWTGLGEIDVIAAAVPEPSAALLGGLGVLALLRRRRA